jgi:isopenicillin N synthase-like dioxygenase
MCTTTNKFFKLPDAQKDLIAHRPGVSGFRRLGGTTARSLDQETPPDLCEAFGVHVTGELSERERATLGDYWASWKLANIWPRVPSDFKETWRKYMIAVTRLSRDLMRLCALALQLDEGFFDGKFDNHVSSLVANYYYPQLKPPKPGQLRRGEHTDWGGLTVLYQEDGPGGLQVHQANTGWRGVPAIPGSFVVNIGDLMAFWTAGQWVSTMHRVITPEQGSASSRLSIPFFYLPNHDAPVEPIEPFAARSAQRRFGSVTAGRLISDKMQKTFSTTYSRPE